MTALFQLYIMMAILIEYSFSNIISCDVASSCAGQSKYCDLNEDCIVSCGDVNSCNGAIIYCPQNGDCNITCTATDGCRGLIINATQQNGNFNLLCESEIISGGDYDHNDICRDIKIYGSTLNINNGNYFNITCGRKRRTCLDAIINCAISMDCNINCKGNRNGSVAVCSSAIINGPIGYDLNIQCLEDDACQQVIIDANQSSKFNIQCIDDKNPCCDTTLYCPVNTNGIKNCIFSGDNWCSKKGQGTDIYAIYSWDDIQIDTTASLDILDGATIHCGSGYNNNCIVSSWNCTNPTDLCIKVPLITTSSSIQPSNTPTLVPTISPSSNPSISSSTQIPNTQNTTTIQPTSNPLTLTPTPVLLTTSIPTTDIPTTNIPTTSIPTTQLPTTSNPTTSNPTTPNPSTSNPSTSNPSTPNPSTSNPSTSNPSTSNPSTSNPTTPNPFTSNPTTPNPSTSNPTTPNPSTSNPTTNIPTTYEPSSNPITNIPTTNPTTVLPTQNPITSKPTTSIPSSNPSTALPSTNPTTTTPSISPTTSIPTTVYPTMYPTSTLPSIYPTTSIPTTSKAEGAETNINMESILAVFQDPQTLWFIIGGLALCICCCSTLLIICVRRSRKETKEIHRKFSNTMDELEKMKSIEKMEKISTASPYGDTPSTQMNKFSDKTEMDPIKMDLENGNFPETEMGKMPRQRTVKFQQTLTENVIEGDAMMDDIINEMNTNKETEIMVGNDKNNQFKIHKHTRNRSYLSKTNTSEVSSSSDDDDDDDDDEEEDDEEDDDEDDEDEDEDTINTETTATESGYNDTNKTVKHIHFKPQIIEIEAISVAQPPSAMDMLPMGGLTDHQSWNQQILQLQAIHHSLYGNEMPLQPISTDNTLHPSQYQVQQNQMNQINQLDVPSPPMTPENGPLSSAHSKMQKSATEISQLSQLTSKYTSASANDEPTDITTTGVSYDDDDDDDEYTGSDDDVLDDFLTPMGTATSLIVNNKGKRSHIENTKSITELDGNIIGHSFQNDINTKNQSFED